MERIASSASDFGRFIGTPAGMVIVGGAVALAVAAVAIAVFAIRLRMARQAELKEEKRQGWTDVTGQLTRADRDFSTELGRQDDVLRDVARMTWIFTNQESNAEDAREYHNLPGIENPTQEQQREKLLTDIQGWIKATPAGERYATENAAHRISVLSTQAVLGKVSTIAIMKWLHEGSPVARAVDDQGAANEVRFRYLDSWLPWHRRMEIERSLSGKVKDGNNDGEHTGETLTYRTRFIYNLRTNRIVEMRSDYRLLASGEEASK